MCNHVYTTMYTQYSIHGYMYGKIRMTSGSCHAGEWIDYCLHGKIILQEHDEIMREGDFCTDFSVSAADQLISRGRLEVNNKLIQ